MGTNLHLGSIVSLMRIPLAFAFLVLFDPSNTTLVWLSILIAVVAQILDHIDGWLARTLSKPSVEGWLFDSVSDRAFYIAAAMAFGREYGVSDVVVWAFVLREICLYAVRVSVGDFAKILPQSRFLALVHAGLIRMSIAIGCVSPLIFHTAADIQYLANTINIILAASIGLGFLTLWWIVRE